MRLLVALLTLSLVLSNEIPPLYLPSFDVDFSGINLFPCSFVCVPHFMNQILYVDANGAAIMPVRGASVLIRFDVQNLRVLEWFQGADPDDFDACVVSKNSTYTFCLLQQLPDGKWLKIYRFTTASVLREYKLLKIIPRSKRGVYTLSRMLIDDTGQLFLGKWYIRKH
jgi:hypothetical protein